MKARDMNVDQYIKWDQRRVALCRTVTNTEAVDNHLRLYRALVSVDGLPSATVAKQVAKSIERLAGIQAGLGELDCILNHQSSNK